MARICATYRIVHVDSGREYIGSSTNLKKRWNVHLRELRLGTHYNRYLQAAWSKYGEAAFVFEIIAEHAPAVIIQAEQALLDDRSPEFNLSPTAYSCKGMKLTAEARAKISESNRRRQPMSAEGRRSISEYRKAHPNRIGLKHSPEAIAKMRAAKIGKPSKKRGVPMSEEQKRKLSIAQSGKKFSEERKAAISARMTGKKRGPYKKRTTES